MDKYTNHHVPSASSREAAVSSETASAFRLPPLGDHWLAQLTPDEIECLLERRAPLLHSMLSASTDAETRAVMYVLNAASSHLDNLESPTYERWGERRDFLVGLLEDVFAEASRRILHAEHLDAERATLTTRPDVGPEPWPAVASSCRLSEPVPSMDDVRSLGRLLADRHGAAWGSLVQLITRRGLRLGEALALRLDSFPNEPQTGQG